MTQLAKRNCGRPPPASRRQVMSPCQESAPLTTVWGIGRSGAHWWPKLCEKRVSGEVLTIVTLTFRQARKSDAGVKSEIVTALQKLRC